MSSNNLGRTETSVNQDNKEATLNGSDAILDGAISDALDVNYSGDVTLTVSDAQLQQHVAFRLTGTPGASPVFKLAPIQRGLIVVYNQTAVDITCKDYTTLTSYSVPAGGTVVLYVQEDAIAGITAAGAIADAPADGTTYGRKDNGWIAVATAYGTEDAQDDIAAMIAAGVHEGITITYDDSGNAISFKVTGNSDYQESVVIASTTNLTLSGTYTAQGVSLSIGDRVLAAGQTAAEDNRIWIVASGAWTIADGWDVTDTITSGTIVPVDRGDYSGQIFQLITADPITLGVSLLSWQSNASASVSNFTIVSATGSTYTPSATQKRHLFNLDTAGAQSFVVPTHASEAIPVGSEYLVSARSTGTKTIDAASGVSINGVSTASLTFSGQYDAWWLKKRANSEWQAWPLRITAGAFGTEDAQDAVAAMIAAGTQTGISFSYNDGSNTLSATVSIQSLLDSIGSTRGSILYRGASGWAALTPGTSGDVLQSNGAGADPSWSAVAAGYTDEDAMDAIAALFAAGTHSGISFSYNDAGDALSATVTATGREKVVADRTYYVDASLGSDSNDGLSAGSGNAFATINKAIDVIYGDIDWNTHTPTISVADGTYNENILLKGTPQGAPSIIITGNNTTPANCILNTSTAPIQVQNGGRANISGFKTTGTHTNVIAVTLGSICNLGSFTFAGTTMTTIIAATNNSSITQNSGAVWTVEQNFTTGWSIRSSSVLNLSSTGSWVFSGSITVSSAFISITQGSQLISSTSGFAFTGSLTGPTGTVTYNSAIQFAGVELASLPGTTGLVLQGACSYTSTGTLTDTPTVLTSNRNNTATDGNKEYISDSASDLTYTIRSNATVAVPIGTELRFYRKGTGKFTIVAGSGVTFSPTGNQEVAFQGGRCVAKKVDTDTWLISGNVLSSGFYTDENAMDIVAAMIAAGTHDGVSFSYNDGSDALSVTAKPTESIIIAASDESTALTTGTGKVTFRMPYAFTLTGIKGSLTTAQTSGSTLTVDVNKGGTTIMSSAKITFDNTEKTTATATTAPALTTTSLADDDEITIDIDAVGDGTAKGLKVYLIGHRT